MIPSSMSVSRDIPRQITVLPGGAINAFPLVPLNVPLKAPGVVGKFEDDVTPPRSALPDASTDTLVAASKDDPPSNVEYTSPDPSGSSLARKASPPPPWFTVEYAPAVVRKSLEVVTPAT